MEILITIAYFFLVRLIFIDYKLLRFTLVWKFVVFGLYAGAALTEVVMLGQYAPYSKEMVVEAYVVQMAPEFGGIVKEVYAVSNKPMKKGDPLFEMDPEPWKQRVAEDQAAFDLTKDGYQRMTRAGRGAVSAEEIVAARDRMREAEAELQKSKYNLDNTQIVAPSDGYPLNVQLRPGTFIRLKRPVLSFVSTEEYYLLATVNQRAARWIEQGGEAEVALSLYPGRVFAAVVDSVIWGRGRAQLTPTGEIPTVVESRQASEIREQYAVRLHVKDQDPRYPLRFGAIGLVAFYTGRGPDVFRLLRELEIRSESWLNFIYNPF